MNTQQIQTIIKLYQKDKISAMKIAKIFNCSEPTIFKILKKYKISIRKRRDYCTKIDENFFEKIDSHHKAQVLGLIYADGCLLRRTGNSWSITIGLQNRDFEYLNQINTIMKHEKPLRKIIKSSGFSKGNTHWLFSTNNYKLAQDIQKLGITQRKSLTCEFPTLDQVPEEFISSFILGYFEGDGCFYLSPKFQAVAFLCCTKDFYTKIQEILINKLNITSKAYLMHEGNDKMFTLRIDGNKQVIKFMDWIYENSNKDLRLDRKYQKYITFKKEYFEKELIRSTEDYKKIIQNKIDIKREKLNGKIYKEFYIQDPNGQIYFSNRIYKFSKDFKLNPQKIAKLLNKEIIEYKGWVFPENIPLSNIIYKIYKSIDLTSNLYKNGIKRKELIYKNFYLKDKNNIIYLCKSVNSVTEQFPIKRYTVERILRINANTRIGLSIPTEQEIETAKQNNSIIELK